MSGITIPQAGIEPGRAANIRREPGKTGAVVAAFGQKLADVGQALETDRLDREAGRKQVEMTQGLGDLRLKFERETNPDVIDTGFGPAAADLRTQLLDTTDPKNRERVGNAFDRLQVRHGLALGATAIKMRSSQRMATLADYSHVAVQTAAADAETRAETKRALKQSYAAAVAAGDLDPAEAQRLNAADNASIDSAAALDMLGADPDMLLLKLKAGEFNDMGAEALARMRNRAASAIASRDAGVAAEAARAAKAREAAITADLNDVRDIARKGRTSANEALLDNPDAKASPAYAEAAAAVALRDAVPGFAKLPPEKQAAMIADIRKRPVGKKFETRNLTELKAVHAASVEAWDKDPIAQAQAIGMKPPAELPPLDAASRRALFSAFHNRLIYGLSLVKTGYITDPAFFTLDERAALKKAAGTDASPQSRARLAEAFSVAFGAETEKALAEISGDAVFDHMSSLLTVGGDMAIAETAFLGQQMLKEKTVRLPKQDDRAAATREFLGPLLADDPATEATLRTVADAIYVARGGTPDAFDPDAYRAALQEAAGGSNVNGGVATFHGDKVFLPPHVDMSLVDDAFNLAIDDLDGSRGPRNFQDVLDKKPPVAVDPEGLWKAASLSGGAPVLGGAPLDELALRRARLLAIGNDRYRLQIPARGQMFDVTDATSKKAFEFSLLKLLAEAAK